MTRAEAIALIQQTMGFRTDLAVRSGAMIDQAQRYLERNWPHRPLPWFMLTERSLTSTKAEEERVEVPDDFVEEFEEDGLWLQLETGGERLLGKYDADDLRKSTQERYAYGTLTQDTDDSPLNYALTGKYFRLFPKPLDVKQVKLIYYATLPLTVDDEDENDWLKHAPYALIGFGGERLAAAARDKDALGMFMQWKEAGIMALANANIERYYANRRMAMGETK